jgi:hypothetical protein
VKNIVKMIFGKDGDNLVVLEQKGLRYGSYRGGWHIFAGERRVCKILSVAVDGRGAVFRCVRCRTFQRLSCCYEHFVQATPEQQTEMLKCLVCGGPLIDEIDIQEQQRLK